MSGVDRRTHSLRELSWAARAKQSEAWDHTASVVATVLNCRMGIKRHQRTDPRSVHPFARKKRRVLSKAERKSKLRALFGPGKKTE